MIDASQKQSSALAQLGPVQASTRSDLVSAALRAAIVSGQLPLGSQLVETRLAELFKVSRGPLREAFRSLADEGLVTIIPYTGAFVTDLGETELVEVMTVRLALELQAFKLCWPRRDKAFRRALNDRHEDLIDASASGDRFAEIQAEMALHAVVFEFSGNALLQQIWRQLAQRIQLGLGVYRLAPSGCVALKEAHQRYLEVALGTDLTAALTEVDQHVTAGIVSVHRYFAEQGEAAARAAS